MTRILALHAGGHDISAAAFEDYRLVAAVSEERLARTKGCGMAVPWLAIDEVMHIADWRRSDVDAIVSTRGVFPLPYYRYSLWDELRYTVKDWSGVKRRQRDQVSLCRRFGTTDTLSLFRADRFLACTGFGPGTQVHFVDHHGAHALAALFYTDWDNALIYTSDGVGDNVSYSFRTLADGVLQCFYGDDRWLLPALHQSGLALAYGYATIACGFRMLRHEGKLVGLSAIGEPKLADELAALFRLGDLGVVETGFRSSQLLQARVLEICRGHDRETIAASIQKVAEDFTLRSLRYWLDRSGARHLALAGGLFANVRLNRLIAETAGLDEVFIFPAMGDEGLPVGAALGYLLARDGLAPWLAQRHRLDNVYLGRDYDHAIDPCLAAAGGVRRLPGAPAALAADLIGAGRIGAIYAGRMEFGPRALGARSIIANPRDGRINDDLNKRLDRSEFMPFAPCVLEEDAARVFEIGNVNRYAAHFMTITCAVRPEWRARIPAVVHVDATARPQIVNEPATPLLAEILRRFREATGLPVLINTSFNVHEEPIINRPNECLRALREKRVDFVVTRQAVYVAD